MPSAGRAVVAGYQLDQLGTAEQTRYLRQVIGFVWQQTARNLLPYLTALENVALPMILDGVPARRAERAGRSSCSGRSTWRTVPTTARTGCRAASSSASRSRSRWPTGPTSSSPTSRPASSTRRPGTRSSSSSGGSTASSGVTIVVATHDPLVSEQVARTVAIRDGRVSSETLRQRTVTGEGDHHVISTEYAVLDRAGRLQLPRAHVEALGLASRVRLELEDDHVGVWPDRPEVPERAQRPDEPDVPATSAEVERPAPQRSPESEPSHAPRQAPASEPPAPPPTRRRHRPWRHRSRRRARSIEATDDRPAADDRDDRPVPRLPERLGRRPRRGRRRPAGRARRAGRDPGPVRLRQDDPAVAHRRARPADGGRSRHRRRVARRDEPGRPGRDAPARVGFIFQAFGLLSILSAAENVEVPLRLVSADPREREDRVAALLEVVGLADRARHRPHELSGGEQQRVAIARALANRPDLLLADEPTGQLDSGTGRSIMTLLRTVVRRENVTALIATHDPMLIDLADRVVELRDGRIVA